MRREGQMVGQAVEDMGRYRPLRPGVFQGCGVWS